MYKNYKKKSYDNNPFMILFNFCRFVMRFWRIFHKNNFALLTSSEPNLFLESSSDLIINWCEDLVTAL